MEVKGLHQEVYEILKDQWIGKTFPKYKIIWFDEEELSASLNAANFPLVFVRCSGGDGVVDPKVSLDSTTYPSLAANGYVSFPVRVEIYGQKQASSTVVTTPDVALTKLLLNIPGAYVTDYMGYKYNSLTGGSFRWKGVDGILKDSVMNKKDVVCYYTDVILKKYIVRERNTDTFFMSKPLNLSVEVEIESPEILPIKEENSILPIENPEIQPIEEHIEIQKTEEPNGTKQTQLSFQ